MKKIPKPFKWFKVTELIDKEVRRFVEEGEKTAKKILTDHRDDLEIIAKGLLEYETLTGDEIKDLLKGIKPSRDEFGDGNSPNTPTPKPSVPKTGESTAPQTN